MHHSGIQAQCIFETLQLRMSIMNILIQRLDLKIYIFSNSAFTTDFGTT